MNPTEHGEFWLRQKDIEQRLLTIDLEQKRQWYGRSPDPPLVPPDWLGFTGEGTTTTPSSSTTTTTTSTSSSSTTTAAGACPTCLEATIGDAEYEAETAYAGESVQMGPTGVFGPSSPCSYGGAGTNIIAANASPDRGDYTADWYATVVWPAYPVGSPLFEQATYKKAAPNTGGTGTYTLFREPASHNLTYPATISVGTCAETTTTTSTSSSSTTTIACTGTCLWLSDAFGEWSRVDTGAFKCAELATCEDCGCPEPNYTPGSAGIYDSTPCSCGGAPTTTTTTTTTSTTTTVACPGGTGTWVWQCSGGVWNESSSDGSCTKPSVPAEYVPCVDSTELQYSCADCSWSLI